mmetsp:Transcript_17904/g.40958  ORF Transcript_17904/g.40958 Transcript_17904/m.40958 type:complete len:313 (-) Transcript_17904:107-1045(-)
MALPSSTSLSSFGNTVLLINYHDAVIYESDLKLIERRTEWLNDSCIHFFFTRLQKELESSLSCAKDNYTPSNLRSFLFMDPSVVSFWMHQCIEQDEIDDVVNSTQFPGRKNKQGDGAVFIAVNDNMSSSSSLTNNSWQVPEGGSHWSLLLVEVVAKRGCEKDDKDTFTTILRFSHFDSIRNSRNIRAAEDIADKIRLHVYPKAATISTAPPFTSVNPNPSEGLVHQAKTPQQQNGHDCGVHVLGAAKILSKHLSMTRSTQDLIGNKESNCRHLQQLEEFLRKEIGDDSEDYCSRLRREVSFDIRGLHKGSEK